MNAIAVITARGGSKRIPGKNIRDFCGKPILAYSVEAALNSELFAEVMVSTDSGQIAETAKAYGANVPFLRSVETSDDYATTADVLSEVLRNYQKIGRCFDAFCCLYPTAPFVTAEKLRKAAETFQISRADSLMCVTRFSYPPQRAVVLRDGFLSWAYPEYERMRSQDLEPLYHDCGQFYFCRTDVFRERNSMVTERTVSFLLPETEVQDIDNEDDWLIAEAKFMALIHPENSIGGGGGNPSSRQ